jgi:hypothetical protein
VASSLTPHITRQILYYFKNNVAAISAHPTYKALHPVIHTALTLRGGLGVVKPPKTTSERMGKETPAEFVYWVSYMAFARRPTQSE